jgi:hypothetical protein
VCRAERDVEAGRVTKEQALERAGWDRATDYERGLLLEIFGLDEPPADLAVSAPAPPEPKPFVPAPRPEPVSEITPEMDALVDALIESWTRPKGEAETAGAGSSPESEAEAG